MKLLLGTFFGAAALVFLTVGRDWNDSDALDARLRLVVTQVPVQATDGAWSLGSSLSSRYPSGSRVVLVEPGSVEPGADGKDVVRILSEGLDAAGAPDLSPEGDRVVFAGRARPESNWCIYEARLARGGPNRRVEISGDCGDPAYLPKGEIVLVVTENSRADESSGPDRESYLCKTSMEDGSEQRITFGPGAPTNPTVLHDGRVLFSMTTDPSGTVHAAPETALFSVNPDGTLLDPFMGFHDESRAEFGARQTEDGRIVFVSEPAASSARTIAWVEFARPMGQRTDVVPRIVEVGTESRSFPLVVASTAPAAEGGLVVTGRAPDSSRAKTFGAFQLAWGGEQAQKLFDDPEWHEVEAVPVTPRRAARARPSSVAAEESTGTLVCYDAGYSDGVHGPQQGASMPSAVAVEMPMRAAEQAGLARDGMVEVSPGIVELGRVTVASDRSFFVRVPADVPIRVRSIDADRESIAHSGWFWIRPGETRACFGCHEPRDTAPPNRVVRAIADPPQELGTTRRVVTE